MPPTVHPYEQVRATANACHISAYLRTDLGPFTAEGFVQGSVAGVLLRRADGQVIARAFEVRG